MSERAIGAAQLVAQLDAALAFGEQGGASQGGASQGGASQGGASQGGASREPSLSALALLAEWAGASGVSLSARPEQISSFMSQARRLRAELSGALDVQLPPELDLTRIAFELQPQRVTLIPARWVGPGVVGGSTRFSCRRGCARRWRSCTRRTSRWPCAWSRSSSS